MHVSGHITNSLNLHIHWSAWRPRAEARSVALCEPLQVLSGENGLHLGCISAGSMSQPDDGQCGNFTFCARGAKFSQDRGLLCSLGWLDPHATCPHWDPRGLWPLTYLQTQLQMRSAVCFLCPQGAKKLSPGGFWRSHPGPDAMCRSGCSSEAMEPCAPLLV